jgi:hypothetical protein
MRKFLFILLTLLLASCSTSITNQVTPVTTTVTKEMLSTQTSAATITIQPTDTPVPTGTNTPRPTPEWMDYQCLDILPNLPNSQTLEGVLVFSLNTLETYLDYGPTNPIKYFPKEEGDRLIYFRVSPDREYITYRQVGPVQPGMKELVVIADANGQPIWSTTAPLSEFLYYWFDNQRLLEWKLNGYALPDITLVNPISGEQQELPNDFPYFIFDEENYWVSFPKFWSGPYLIFNPDMTQVVYPELVNHEDGFLVTLWDLETNQPVVKVITQDTFGGMPIWLPGGEKFLIGLRTDIEHIDFANDFFLVSREGQIQQLTRFKDDYKTVNISHSYSLSPNGHLVAFWVAVQPDSLEDDRLAVLDLETGLVTNYCIPGGPFANNAALDNSESPIWSPDSTQMLVVSRDPEDSSIRRVILVDVAEGFAAQIATEVEPVGWMVAP